MLFFCQAMTYIAKLPRQCAQLVDGVERHQCHWWHGQTPAHHVCPWRKHVGVVDWRVESGKAHHHHELWENGFFTKASKYKSNLILSLDGNVLFKVSTGCWSQQGWPRKCKSTNVGMRVLCSCARKQYFLSLWVSSWSTEGSTDAV